LIRKNATKGAIIVVNYLNADWDIGLLEAIRKGVRADLASEAKRNAERETEDDRKIDLAAVPATEAIFVIGKVFRVRVDSTKLRKTLLQLISLKVKKTGRI
jgi:hypothetical protein